MNSVHHERPKQTFGHQTQHEVTRCISSIPPWDGMLGQYSGLPPLDFHVQVPIYTLQRTGWDGMVGQYSWLPPLDFHVQVPIYTL